MLRNLLFVFLLISFSILVYVAWNQGYFESGSGTGIFSSFNKPTSKISLTETLPANDVERRHLQNDLQSEIDSLGISDNVSIYYKNLKGKYEVMINADRAWNPASMVKAYVVIEAFRQQRLKLINFDSRIVIRPENVVSTELESPEYQPLRAGGRETIRDLVYAMIVQSDNTAYNTLLDVLDRRNVSASLKTIGLTNTTVGEKLSLNDDQYSVDLQVLGRQSNRTTASDLGKLFDLLYQKKIENSDDILAIFKKQKLVNMIPALLPSNTVIAHKTGTYSPYYHDGGIVYKPDDPFILVIFSNTDDPSTIAKLSKVAYYRSRDVLGAQTSWWERLFGRLKK